MRKALLFREFWEQVVQSPLFSPNGVPEPTLYPPSSLGARAHISDRNLAATLDSRKKKSQRMSAFPSPALGAERGRVESLVALTDACFMFSSLETHAGDDPSAAC